MIVNCNWIEIAVFGFQHLVCHMLWYFYQLYFSKYFSPLVCWKTKQPSWEKVEGSWFNLVPDAEGWSSGEGSQWKIWLHPSCSRQLAEVAVNEDWWMWPKVFMGASGKATGHLPGCNLGIIVWALWTCHWPLCCLEPTGTPAVAPLLPGCPVCWGFGGQWKGLQGVCTQHSGVILTQSWEVFLALNKNAYTLKKK